jgi:hypothetical protein
MKNVKYVGEGGEQGEEVRIKEEKGEKNKVN